MRAKRSITAKDIRCFSPFFDRNIASEGTIILLAFTICPIAVGVGDNALPLAECRSEARPSSILKGMNAMEKSEETTSNPFSARSLTIFLFHKILDFLE